MSKTAAETEISTLNAATKNSASNSPVIGASTSKEATNPFSGLAETLKDLEKTLIEHQNQNSVDAKTKTEDQKSHMENVITPTDPHLMSIVKIVTKRKVFNYLHPYQAPSIEDGWGTGFVMSGKKILTSAHVIANYAFIQIVFKEKKYPATIGEGAKNYPGDMALLDVASDEFWDQTKPVEFSGTIQFGKDIQVYGYPIGGDTISITKGVPSRLVMHVYNPQKAHLPALQIDAALNGGNSGGPVFQDNKVIGMAMSVHGERQAIGYITPCILIYQFLKDIYIHRGIPKGFPCASEFYYQEMENVYCRKRCKMQFRKKFLSYLSKET